jgi:hypothetical protein
MMNFVETGMKFWEASMNYYLETGKKIEAAMISDDSKLGRGFTRINTDDRNNAVFLQVKIFF